MDPYHLHLEWPVADVLAYALLRTIDDLEARAVVAEHHDPDLGPVSATAYRTDIRRLQTVLARIAPGARDPDPRLAAVRWLDGTYTVVHGRPVRLIAQPDVLGLVESSLDLVSQQLLDPHDALVAVHQHLVDVDEHPELASDADSTPRTQASTELQAVSLPTLQAAHRIAPGCGPAPGPASGAGAGRC
jgi:hypothetical protein